MPLIKICFLRKNGMVEGKLYLFTYNGNRQYKLEEKKNNAVYMFKIVVGIFRRPNFFAHCANHLIDMIVRNCKRPGLAHKHERQRDEQRKQPDETDRDE